MENPDIVIVDDDPMVGELSRDLLTDAGYKVTLVQDSMEAIPTIKAQMPRLIVTDIMMPGITGMDICKAVKSDRALKHIKIIVVSGKSYQVEKQRAFQFGADFFLQKPYNVETFSSTVKSILDGVTANPAPPPAAPMSSSIIHENEPVQTSDLQPGQIRVTVWGARGLPALMPNTPSRYGRQTSCLSVETKDHLFIFDAGTGIVELGREIVAKKRYYKDIWICLTHFHLDHILGLGRFAPLYDSNFSIHLIASNDPEKSLKEVAQSTFYSSFALTKQPPKAKIDVYEILEDNYELFPGVKLSAMYANHPTSTLVYMLDMLGKKITYAPDSEIWGDATAFQDYDEKFGGFCKGSDLFVHDAVYTDKDYETRKHEGHSGLSIVVDFAAEKVQAKELVLWHANPDYSDEDLDRMLTDAKTRAQAKGFTMQCHLPQERHSFLLQGHP
ncbi:MAG: response regulator [Elusimicrobiales bacterium]|nr:response regulator [Elusimicrobiales bacterium]